MDKIELVGVPQSSYTRAVRIALEEKGVPYDLNPARPHTPPVDAIHPFGKVPVMRHGDFELCESRAIVNYVDHTFQGPALMPADPKAAALAEQWISIFNTVMDQPLVRKYVFAYIFPGTEDKSPNRKLIDEALPAVRDHIALLDKAVAKTGHLAGDNYTFADMNVMAPLYWVKAFPEGGEAIAKARNLAAYYERNAARPSFAKTMPPPVG